MKIARWVMVHAVAGFTGLALLGVPGTTVAFGHGRDAAASAPIVSLCGPGAAWSAAAPGVDLLAGGGVVRVSWNARAGQLVKLLLPRPLALPKTIRRLDVYACNTSVRYAPPVGCAFLLRDGQGRPFTCGAPPISTSWQRHSASMFGKAAPATLLGVALRPAANGPLQLALGGIEAQVAPRRAIRDYWGVLPQRTTPRVQPYFEYGGEPFLYADYLADRPGAYSVILAVRRQWQGPTVWQRRSKFKVAARPAPETQTGPKLNLPPGNYWLTAHVFDASGRFLYCRAFQADVVRRGAKLPPLVRPVREPMALEVRTDEPENVFPPGARVQVKVLAPAAAAYPLTLQFRLWDFYGRRLLQRANRVVTACGVVRWRPESSMLKAGNVYQIRVRCLRAGRVLDTARAMLGLANAAPRGVPSALRPPKRTPVAGPSRETMAVTAYWEPYNYGGSHWPFRDFERLVALARRNHCREVRIDLNWPTLEPLPGVFRFGGPDRMVKAVEAAGLNAAFEIYGFYNVPEWVRSFHCMADSEDDIHNLWGHNGGVSRVPSPSSPRFLAALGRLWRAVAGHYANAPAVVGYTFLGTFADHFYFDSQPGTMVDYSPAARRGFRRFLQAVKGYSLARLGRRYHAKFRSWRQVRLPRPNSAPRGKPDFRPRWLDFLAFRRWAFRHYVHTVVRAIRSADKRAWIHLYYLGQAPMDSVLDYLQSHGGALDDGGDEQESSVVQASPTFYLRHMQDLTESVQQMPTSRYSVYMLFTKLYYSGRGGDFRWLWNMTAARNAAQRARWLAVMNYFARRWRPVLNRLFAARCPQLDLAVLAPVMADNLSRRYLHSYWATQQWPSGWLDDVLLQGHQFPYWVGPWDHPTKALRGARLALVRGDMSIGSSHYWSAVATWARRGGKLVLLSPDAGRWALNQPRRDFYLLGRLGLQLRSTGRRLHDHDVFTNGQGPFARGRAVPLSTRGLDGRPGFEELRPTGRPYRTLATFSDGCPAVVSFHCGQGQVVVFLQTVDCFKLFDPVPAQRAAPGRNVIDDLCRWAKVRRFFASNQPAFRLSWLNEGRRHFLLVHRYQPPSWYLPNHLEPPLLAGAVKVYTLASASTYVVTDLLQPHVPSLVATGQALGTKGLVVTGMTPGETRIYEISAHE